MTGYFNEKFGNWLPFEPTPIMESEDGFNVYKGDIIYQLEGTDEWYLDRANLIERIKDELIVSKEAE